MDDATSTIFIKNRTGYVYRDLAIARLWGDFVLYGVSGTEGSAYRYLFVDFTGIN